jgi:transposase
MGLYCGIDLHSNNHMLMIIDDADQRVYERRLPNDLAITKAAVEPYRAELVAVAVESTFNWYWLVDGLMEAGYTVRLVNTAAVRQYEGLKHSEDEHYAFWLAHRRRGTSTLRASTGCGTWPDNGCVWCSIAVR